MPGDPRERIPRFHSAFCAATTAPGRRISATVVRESASRKNDPVHAIQADAVRAIVFDFDGLLMDTESTSFLSWQYEWSQWGLTLPVADFFVNHGGDVTEDRYAVLAAAVGPRFDLSLIHI